MILSTFCLLEKKPSFYLFRGTFAFLAGIERGKSFKLLRTLGQDYWRSFSGISYLWQHGIPKMTNESLHKSSTHKTRIIYRNVETWKTPKPPLRSPWAQPSPPTQYSLMISSHSFFAQVFFWCWSSFTLFSYTGTNKPYVLRASKSAISPTFIQWIEASEQEIQSEPDKTGLRKNWPTKSLDRLWRCRIYVVGGQNTSSNK